MFMGLLLSLFGGLAERSQTMNWTFVSYLSESIFEIGKNFIKFFPLTTSNIALKGKTSTFRERP
ncbi:MAG: hypothetical protein CL925_10605 [Deltaproteobacteria bacterium]|nr:hypothetical protein [Deltaproteobacteria bacterium]